MSSSIRCRITGCDLDECGVCRRCGSDRQAEHDWHEIERERPCYRRMSCSRCQAEREQPEQDQAEA